MSTIKVNTIQTTGGVEVYTAKAWIRFNGNTNTIDASEGVSSITDNGTGLHTINFTNAFSTASFGAGLSFEQGNFTANNLSFGESAFAQATTTTYPTHGQSSNGAEWDCNNAGGVFIE